MNMLKVVSPGLKALIGRFGLPLIVNQPDLLRLGGAGAIIACNHVGWADSFWIAYSLYPRQLRYMSKKELFNSRVSRWVLEQAGSFPVNRTYPSPSTIKAAINIVQQGEVILIFPSGTRNEGNSIFKRGAAAVALQAGVPLVPAFYQGPKRMQLNHLVNRPHIRVAFGKPIPTADLAPGKLTTNALTRELQTAIEELRSVANSSFS